jgi:hypothetical protein
VFIKCILKKIKPFIDIYVVINDCNSNNDNITISINNFNGNIKIVIYDLNGNRLQISNENTISLRDYYKGIYLLRVNYGDRVEVVKAIKY